MPWSKNDYPASLKNLPADVRNKAIEIGNALLDEGYEEGRAIAIATDRAHKSEEGTDADKTEYHVKPHDDGWQLIKKGSSRAIMVEDTKGDLLSKAKDYVTDHSGTLVIHKQDGSVEQELYDQ
ncbi:DUF2188 domain-containing protein [Rossellomorea aquimaris]|jgi:Uncharacterized protein conserved in bacteria (DUF2188)|uniref:DUF2188 domain-containing protein n=1 Tax=Rossellomorea aquimaris TaxID=189382 RepID=A0A1J6W4V0_9BACI|nr:DUF2188 domain-containing protein [Rossellomorea aquimaris]OIU66896.1 hypothetical protein BHE18_13365 [Rossellomorea aquimaris]